MFCFIYCVILVPHRMGTKMKRLLIFLLMGDACSYEMAYMLPLVLLLLANFEVSLIPGSGVPIDGPTSFMV